MIPSSVKILVCRQPVDMRRSFDGLALAVEAATGRQLGPNTLVCFVNKRRTHLKALWLDASGVCLLYKRANRFRFELPVGPHGDVVVVDATQLAKLVAGVPQKRHSREP